MEKESKLKILHIRIGNLHKLLSEIQTRNPLRSRVESDMQDIHKCFVQTPC